MSEVKQRCCATVWGGYHSSSCAKNAKFERDGKWYCGTHDPVSRKKKNEERDANRLIEWERKNKVFQLQNSASDLLAALEALYGAIGSCVELTPDVLRNARDAIKKAKGES